MWVNIDRELGLFADISSVPHGVLTTGKILEPNVWCLKKALPIEDFCLAKFALCSGKSCPTRGLESSNVFLVYELYCSLHTTVFVDFNRHQALCLVA